MSCKLCWHHNLRKFSRRDCAEWHACVTHTQISSKQHIISSYDVSTILSRLWDEERSLGPLQHRSTIQSKTVFNNISTIWYSNYGSEREGGRGTTRSSPGGQWHDDSRCCLREEVLRTLHTNAMHIQMCAICLYGGRSPMLRHFIFGKTPTQPIH